MSFCVHSSARFSGLNASTPYYRMVYVVHMHTRLYDADRVVDQKRPPVGDPRRTTWPHHMNDAEPLVELRDKPTFSGILHRTDLANEAGGTEDRDRLRRLRDEAAVRQPHEQVQYRRSRRKHLDRRQIRWDWVRDDLPVELVAQRDRVLELIAKSPLLRLPVVPDLRLAQEVEARALDDLRFRSKRVNSEEDCSPEYPLERCNQAPIFFSSLAHSERFEHLCGRLEPDCLALLTNGKSSKEDRHDPILTEGDAELGVAGDLERKLPVAALVEQFAGWRSPDRKPTKNERTRAEAQALIPLLPLDSDKFDAFNLC
jgi:hypothetical protein